MSENLKKFLEFVGNNPELLEKAKQLKADDPEKAKEIAIAFAKENGFELTEADFEVPEGELSEDELNAVAGGGDCYCLLGGGGTESNYDDVCACVVAGFGYYKDSFKPYSTADNLLRCVCSVLGDGYNGDDTAATWK